MARDFAKSFYESSAWKKARGSYIKLRQATDGGMCERCQDQTGLIVHHVIWLSPGNINNPEISLSYDNFQLVCQDCHNAIHNNDIDGIYATRNRYRFDSDGNPVGLPPV